MQRLARLSSRVVVSRAPLCAVARPLVVRRNFSAAAPATTEVPDHVREIGQKILHLNMVETQQLTQYLRAELGLPEGFGMALMGGGGMGGGAAGGGGAADAAPAAPVEEKTAFTVKLTSFGAEKVKVIKEVRGLTGLGLKEAKELVEGAPCELKVGVTKEEAEKYKDIITKAGGVVEVL